MDVHKWLNDRTILEAYSGSIVYGTDIEGSDIDFRGVAIPPKDYFIGMYNFDEAKSDDPDRVIYGIKKWFRLAVGGNPNFLELLWTPENYFVMKQRQGKMLLDRRDIFLGKHVKPKYIGFAHGQRHRMDQLNKTETTNPKRLALIEKFGFDTKKAMHLIRLMRTGFEIITEGTIHVQRHDARELLAIRRGEWSKEKILDEAQKIEDLINQAMVTSTLPMKPDAKAVNELLMELVESKWY